MAGQLRYALRTRSAISAPEILPLCESPALRSRTVVPDKRGVFQVVLHEGVEPVRVDAVDAGQPYTLHPTRYTLHPTPYTSDPRPYTSDPTSYILQPRPWP
eukprot:3790579-Rhodomonas_salina.2